MWGWNCQMWEKRKGTTKCEKRIVTFGVRTAQYEDETIKCEKKAREPTNVTKELSHVMLELHNVRMKPSNVRKKSKGTTKCVKKLSHVVLELHNVRMEPSSARKKKGNHLMWQKTVTCDVGTTQCEDETVKYEKKSKGTTQTVKCEKKK